MVSRAEGKNKTQPRADTWPGAFKAIGVRAVSRGQLVSFGILIVAVILAWRVESSTLLEIFKLLISSEAALYSGWLLFVVTFFGSLILFSAQRKMYLAEIDRIARERTKLQQKLSPDIESSK